MRYRRRLARAIAVPLAVVLGACSGTGKPVIRAAAPGAHLGGTLRIGITTPGSIDPANAYEPMGDLVMSAMCEPLIGFDPVTGVPKPGLASSWQVSDSGTRITIQIRKGARFSDGEPVTAQDVVFSLSRIAKQESASYVASLMQPVGGFGWVHGDQQTDDPLKKRQLAGLRVIENNSFEISLAAADADFIRTLGHIATAPVPQKAVERDPDAFAKRPVCAGPYRLAAPYTPGARSIVLTRSPYYDGANPVYTRGGAGYADRLEFDIFPNLAAEVKAFDGGALDIAQVPSSEIASARTRHPLEFVQAPNGSVEYVGLPTTVPPFDDPAVRFALTSALDPSKIVPQVYGGAAVPADSILPPTLGDEYHPGICREARAKVPAAQVARARASLRGKTFTFTYNDEYDNGRLARAVTAALRPLGVKVTPAPIGWDRFVSAGTGSPGFAGPFSESWRAEVPSADRYLGPLMTLTGIGDGNFSRFSDRSFERYLTRQAREANDDVDRVLAYRTLEREACAFSALAPIAFVENSFLVRTSRVGSTTKSYTERTNGEPVLRELYVKA